MINRKHLFSESAVWKTFSEFTDANGIMTTGKGESVITIDGSVITNNSWVENSDLTINNRYLIHILSDIKYTYQSENPALGIQNGSYFIAGNTVFSEFTIEGSELHGYEIIERKVNTCYAKGALLNGKVLVNTWEAVMNKPTIDDDRFQIRRLDNTDAVPYDLLYLADPSEEAVAFYLERGTCYIGLLDNKIIGEYVILPTRPSTIELINVAVEEDYQGMGFGKKLVKHAIEQGRKGNYQVMEVGTGDAGIGQLALYQKCGFTMDTIDKDFFKRHYPEPIFENGIELRHMVRLKLDLTL